MLATLIIWALLPILAILGFIYAVIASAIGNWRPLSVYRALRG